MTMLRFSDAVTNLLKRSGWSPDRKVDIAGVGRDLDAAGLPLNSFAVNVLETLYKIRVSPPRNANGTYRPEDVFFDPLYDQEFDRILAWIAWLENVAPIGKGFGRRSSLVLTGTGAMFGISDIGVHQIGPDFTSAMDNLLLGIQRPTLIYDVKQCFPTQ